MLGYDKLLIKYKNLKLGWIINYIYKWEINRYFIKSLGYSKM